LDFEVRITEPALADLEEILDYSVANHPASAEHFLSALLRHVEILRQFPYIGKLVSQRFGVRQLVHTPFLIYYAVFPGWRRVEVLHFWHSSRMPPGS
jgi:plasmid stabilization system protein ParE